MKKYNELNRLEKKARTSSGRINCEKCPMFMRCNELIMDACDYIYLTAFRKGYNTHKKETKNKK